MSQTVPFPIAAPFVLSRCIPTSPEIGFGVTRGWLNPDDAIALAVGKLERGAPLSSAEETLALLLSDERETVWDLATNLESSSEPAELRARLWMFLALDWVHSFRTRYTDPYEVLEMIFAEFEYPEEMAGLVRWMPVSSHEVLGLQALDARWEHYLAERRLEYARRVP